MLTDVLLALIAVLNAAIVMQLWRIAKNTNPPNRK
jgi:hypothetical protein